MRRILVCCVVFWCVHGIAAAEECGRDDLKQIVTQAGTALTIMNKDKTEAFHLRLKELKNKRGWTDKEMLTKAAPIVKNDAVTAFDAKTKIIFAQITNLGQGAETASCQMRDRLQGLLGNLVENNVAKWALIMDGLEAELKK